MFFCFSTVHFSVLINSEVLALFPSSRGLREGVPLSLFVHFDDVDFQSTCD